MKKDRYDNRKIPDQKKQLKTAQHWHLYMVYHDEDFIKDIANLPEPPKRLLDAGKEWKEPYIMIAKKYSIRYGDVYRYKKRGLGGLFIGLGQMYGFVTHNREIDAINITVEKDIKKEEFMKMWYWVKRHQTEDLGLRETKRKAPEEPELIYAVFKARSNKKTFREIFSMYQNGELLGYEGTTNKYSSEDSLERYYNKYKPNPDG